MVRAGLKTRSLHGLREYQYRGSPETARRLRHWYQLLPRRISVESGARSELFLSRENHHDGTRGAPRIGDDADLRELRWRGIHDARHVRLGDGTRGDDGRQIVVDE